MEKRPMKRPRLTWDIILPVAPLPHPKMSAGLSGDLGNMDRPSLTPPEASQGQAMGAPIKDHLESQIISQWSNLSNSVERCLKERIGYRLRLAVSEGRVQELESLLDVTCSEMDCVRNAYEKARVSWEKEKAVFEGERRRLKLALAEANRCRDEAISARLESDRINNEKTRMLAKEISELKECVEAGKLAVHDESKKVGLMRVAQECVKKINKGYMDGFADALNGAGVPHSDPVWLNLSFPYPRHAPRLAPGWGVTASSRVRSAPAAPIITTPVSTFVPNQTCLP